MKKLIGFLNPMLRLGNQRYSFFFPFFSNLALTVLSEFYVYNVAHNPMAVGAYIIFLNVALIIYFAFRDGILGGFIASLISIFYYFYIVYSRHYSGIQLRKGIETILVLGTLYFLLAAIIGWLKQSIDKLIEKEANGKKHLEAIIQQLPVGVLITDKEGRLMQRNKQVDTILGVRMPIGFVLGKDTLTTEKIDGHPIDPSQSPLADALKTGKSIIGKEYIFERKDGKKVFLQVSSAPIHNKKDDIIAAASIITDITHQKDLERQKDEFLGIASHELKTPVTSIKAYGQVLQKVFERKGELAAVKQLQKLDLQVDKLTNLIGDLLDVTKIQSGKLVFSRTLFDFNALVKEIIDEMQITTENHTIKATFGKTKKILADRDRIGQVLTNLLSNAIKYSPDASEIIVKTGSDKSNVTFSVQDFGIGIPKDKQSKVFDQFFRVSGAEQNTFPGLGLGLFVSAQFIEREGGKIWVESAERKGSTFCFSLPLKSQNRLETRKSS